MTISNGVFRFLSLTISVLYLTVFLGCKSTDSVSDSKEARASGRSAVDGTTLLGEADCGFLTDFPWKLTHTVENRMCKVSVTFNAAYPIKGFTYVVDGDMAYKGTYLDRGDTIYLDFEGKEYTGYRAFKVLGFGKIVDQSQKLYLVGKYTRQ